MSFFVTVPLPKDMKRESRDAFSLLALRVAGGLSFQGMEDWQIDLDAKTMVLGVEREFHDLVGRGKMTSSLKVFFEKAKDAATFRSILQSTFEGLKIGPVKKLERRDWMKEWRRHYKTQVIGKGTNKLILVPSWKKKPKGLVVRVSPGQAFGTGTHPTTRMCLEFIQENFPQVEGRKVLDFGAGTGVLGLACLVMDKGTQVYAVESDKEALEQCGKNFQLNGKKGNLTLKLPQGNFDWVLANVLAPVLIEFRESLASRLKAGGFLVVSGILEKERSSFHKKFVSPSLRLVEAKKEGDWAALLYQKKPAT